MIGNGLSMNRGTWNDAETHSAVYGTEPTPISMSVGWFRNQATRGSEIDSDRRHFSRGWGGWRKSSQNVTIKVVRASDTATTGVCQESAPLT